MSETRTLCTLQKPKITIIEPLAARLDSGATPTNTIPKKRVAAYARVSTEQDEQQSSYEAQLKYYTEYIQSNPDWEFVKVYADEGISGTSVKHRDGFNQMVADAKAGKIDLILTKSISRFSRNTVDSLNTTRELKKHNVEVRFEKENVSSFDASAELVFTIFSSIAQEESRSISENVTWGHQRRMEQGKTQVAFSRFLGYDKGPDGSWVINESEAKIVREIYNLFLAGTTINQIARVLTDKKYKTPGGKDIWRTQTVNSILTNEKYKGDALLQKSYTVDFLTKETRKNHGEKKQIYVHGHHPAIIEPERFDLVQSEIKRRSKHQRQISNNSPFTTKITCPDCSGFYGHKVHHGRDVWYCNHKYENEQKCNSPIFHEEEIKEMFCRALGQELAQIAAGNGPVPPTAEEEAKLSLRLRKARDQAAETLEAALNNFQKQQSQLTPEEYDAGVEHITALKEALEVADAAIIEHAARREKRRWFMDVTAELTTDNITYSDSLFTATVEIIHVQKNKANTYELEFVFKNGAKVTVDR